jgi:hypothetical protein
MLFRELWDQFTYSLFRVIRHRSHDTYTTLKAFGTADEVQLELAREELGASVAEAPIGIRVGNDGDNDVILFDTAGLQFFNELCIQRGLLSLQLHEKPVREPYAGNLQARFDERGGETERWTTRRAQPRKTLRASGAAGPVRYRASPRLHQV